MKSRIHITLDEATVKELDNIKRITRISKSEILDAIIKDGIKDIKAMNNDYSKFIAKYIINEEV